MKRTFLLSLILIFFLIPNSGISQERTNKKDIDQIKKLESKIDSLLVITYTSSNKNEIYGLYKEAQNNIVLANRIIDYSAMLFGAITVMFIIAAILGTTEFSRIRKMRRRINKELKIIQSRRKSGEQSIRTITEQIEIISRHIITIILRLSEGNDFYDRGYYHAAIDSYKSILDIKNLHNSIISNIYFLIGRANSANGKFEEAELAFNYALKHNPNNFEAYHGLGNSYRNKIIIDLDKALENFEEVLKINPDHLGTYNLMGLVYREKNDFSKSLLCFEKAWSINKSAYTAFYLSLLYLKQNEKKKSEIFLKKSFEMANDGIKKGLKLHWLNHIIGVINILNDKFEEGINSFKVGLSYNKSQMVKNAMIGHLEFISDILIKKIGKRKYDSIIKLFQ